jgi:hypothetical protein
MQTIQAKNFHKMSFIISLAGGVCTILANIKQSKGEQLVKDESSWTV